MMGTAERPANLVTAQITAAPRYPGRKAFVASQLLVSNSGMGSRPAVTPVIWDLPEERPASEIRIRRLLFSTFRPTPSPEFQCPLPWAAQIPTGMLYPSGSCHNPLTEPSA